MREAVTPIWKNTLITKLSNLGEFHVLAGSHVLAKGKGCTINSPSPNEFVPSMIDRSKALLVPSGWKSRVTLCVTSLSFSFLSLTQEGSLLQVFVSVYAMVPHFICLLDGRPRNVHWPHYTKQRFNRFLPFGRGVILVKTLSGTPVRVFQSRYTIAIVYRLMFFLYHKVSRYTPPRPHLSWGIARLCWKHATSIPAQAAVSPIAPEGVSKLYCRKSRFKTTLSQDIVLCAAACQLISAHLGRCVCVCVPRTGASSIIYLVLVSWHFNQCRAKRYTRRGFICGFVLGRGRCAVLVWTILCSVVALCALTLARGRFATEGAETEKG